MLCIKQPVTLFNPFEAKTPQTKQCHLMWMETRSSLMLHWTHICVINQLFMSVEFNQIFCLAESSKEHVAFFQISEDRPEQRRCSLNAPPHAVKKNYRYKP